MKRSSPAGAVKAHRLSLSDLVSEAASGMLARPGRAVLTTLGTVIGVTVFVATLGLASTAAGQISSRFDAMTATAVTVSDQVRSSEVPTGVTPGFGAENPEAAAAAVNGVNEVGMYYPPETTGADGRQAEGSLQVPGPPSAQDTGVSLDVLGVTTGYFGAVHAELGQGRFFGPFHEDNAEHVAVLGRAAAERLGIESIGNRPTVFVGRRPFTVIGTVEEVERNPGTLNSIIVPMATAENVWKGPEPGQGSMRMILDTELGAAQQVGAEIRAAIRPDYPDALRVQVPPDPRTLRDGIDTDMAGLSLALATVCLGVGAVGIANTTLVSVIERIPEIGLRRALGARRAQIAGQFLMESAGLGLVGGVVGAALGSAGVIAVSVVQGWGPLMDPRTVAAAPVIGTGVGLLAGAYPAWRAAKTEPAQALRS